MTGSSRYKDKRGLFINIAAQNSLPSEVLMPFLKWMPGYSVKIEEMDNQHKKLIDLTNRVHDSITKSKGREEVKSAFENLAAFVQEHFTAEEQLMRRIKFNKYSSHKAEHEKLVGRVLDLKRRLASDSAPTSYEILHFLKTWLVDHIQEKDSEYGDYISALAEAKARVKVKTK
jgi:hemerythrin